MRKTNIIYNVLTQMAVLLPSVFCALYSNAQISLADRLNYVLEAQDLDTGVKIYNEVTEADLRQLSDSSLFIYHYLGAYINSELLPDNEKNPEKALSHFLEAKRLCETSIGVHSGDYMEVMRGLGDTYIELGQCEEAANIYQEGIVKSMYMRDVVPHDFGNLIIGLQECYEQLGWFGEIPSHLQDAWIFWKKDFEPFETYNYYPLWSLQQFYRRYGMYDKAIETSNEIEKFIISDGRGNTHPELCEALYFQGNILNEAGRREEAISAYERGISIAKVNNLQTSEILGSIYGNLIIALADEGKVSKCNELLPSLKVYGESINDNRFFANAVYSCARHFEEAKNYKDALSFLNLIPLVGFTDNELNNIEEMRDSYTKGIGILSNFENILKSLEGYDIGSPEWFNISINIAEGHMIKGNIRESFNTLESIYLAYIANPSIQEVSPIFLLNCLMNLSTQLKDDSSFLKYALCKRDYLMSINDVPEEFIVNNINEIVVGQLRCGDLDGIDERLMQIKSYYLSRYGELSSEYATYLHNRGRAYQLQNNFDKAKETLLHSINIQNKIEGKTINKTIQYYIEVERQLSEL